MNPKSPFSIALATALTLGTLISLVQGINNAVLRVNGSQDFIWEPSRMLLHGEDPHALYRAHGASAFSLPAGADYPASAMMMLWPYAALDLPLAKVMWALSNLLFTALILRYLYGMMPMEISAIQKLLLGSLLIMGTPWRNAVGNGQHVLLALAFFLLAVAIYKRSARTAPVAVSLAVSWMKYPITFPLAIHFAQTKMGWRAIVVAGAIHLALMMFLVVWTGSPLPDLLLGSLRVARTMVGEGYVSVFALARDFGITSMILPGIFGMLLIGVTACVVPRRDSDVLSSLSTLTLATMLAVPHENYDFVALVIPLALVIRDGVRSSRSVLYLVGVILVWYGDKLMRWATGGDGMGLEIFTWLVAAVLYAALFHDWYLALRSGGTLTVEGETGNAGVHRQPPHGES